MCYGVPPLGIHYSAALLQTRPQAMSYGVPSGYTLFCSSAADPPAGHVLRGALWVYIIPLFTADPPAGHELQGALWV